jgi:hypothetical protein
MSLVGHSLQVRPRPFVHKCPLCINTDRKFWALGFVAMCQEATYAPQQTAPLFDHLVGAGEQRRWHVEAERPCSPEVDDQLELGRCLHGQLGWLLTSEDAVDVAGGLPVLVDDISPVRDQAAGLLLARADEVIE